MTERQEDQLTEELEELQYEMCKKLFHVIGAKWDAPSLQRDLEVMNLQRNRLMIELRDIES